MLGFPDGRWQARWIWSDVPRIRLRGLRFEAESPEAVQATVLLRRRIDLATVPAHAPARMTADGRYALFVNDTEVCRGPIRAGAGRLYADEIDLAPYLRIGPNIIAVMARHPGHPSPWWAPFPAALQLGAGGFVFEARLDDRHTLVSDASWRALRCNAFESEIPRGIGGMSAECVDARQLPADWQATAFDDTGWSSAVALAGNHLGFGGRHEPPSHPFGALQRSPIPQRDGALRTARLISCATAADRADLEADPVTRAQADAVRAAAFSIRMSSDDRPSDTFECRSGDVSVVTFDFGEIVAGTILLELDAPEGAYVDLAAAEAQRPDGSLDFDEQHSGLRYHTRGHRDDFETLDPMGLRFATLSVRATAPVRVRRLAVRERLCPRAPGPAFECSDETLNAIWRAGRRTVDLCSQDAYLDCPTREQRAWTGDSVVHQMVDFATNADVSLAVRHVELAASPRADGMLPMAVGGDFEFHNGVFIPDWALHWVRSLHNLWRWTGDRERVAALIPVAERVVRWFDAFAGHDGLARDVTGWVIIDWSSVSVDGASSALNALLARALRDIEEMSHWLGDAGRASWARRRRDRIAAAFDVFWDETRGVYVDHVVEGRRQRPVSQHALATPLAAGLVPSDRIVRVVDALLDESRLVHATWSRAHGDARVPREGERGVAGPYLLTAPPAPWWNVEHEIVRAQPFYRYVVHDALAEHGYANRLPALCRDWNSLLERCATTLSETWYGGTTCHGWSATPTRDLVVRTLGVTPAEPGFGRARIAPCLGDLAWARGAAPTPAGWIHVDVTHERLVVDSPVPMRIELPGQPPIEHTAGRAEIVLP